MTFCCCAQPAHLLSHTCVRRQQELPRTKLDCPPAAAAVAVLTACTSQQHQAARLARSGTHRPAGKYTHSHSPAQTRRSPDTQGTQTHVRPAAAAHRCSRARPQACGCRTHSSRRSLSTGRPHHPRRQLQQTTRTTAHVSGPSLRQQPLKLFAARHSRRDATLTSTTREAKNHLSFLNSLPKAPKVLLMASQLMTGSS